MHHQQQHLGVSSSVQRLPDVNAASPQIFAASLEQRGGKTQHRTAIYKPTAGGPLRDLFCGKYNAAPRIGNEPRKKVAKKERSAGLMQYFQRED